MMTGSMVVLISSKLFV